MENEDQALLGSFAEDDIMQPLTEGQDTNEQSSVSAVAKRKKIVRRRKNDDKELETPGASFSTAGSGGLPIHQSNSASKPLRGSLQSDLFSNAVENSSEQMEAAPKPELAPPEARNGISEALQISIPSHEIDPDSWIASFKDVHELIAREAQDADDDSALFFFIHRSDLLALPDAAMPSFKDLLQQGKLHPHEIELIKVLRGLYRGAFATVSYRWETSEHPDTKGEVLKKIKQFVAAVDSQWFFVDYMCLPQDIRQSSGGTPSGRSSVESAYYRKALQSIPMLYLATDVLILLERDYNRRFWCLLEAYMAMRRADQEGLSLSSLDHHQTSAFRHHFFNPDDKDGISSLRSETKTSLNALVERLCEDEIGVSRAEDKTTMVQSLRLLEQLIQNNWSRLEEHDSHSASLLNHLLDNKVRVDDIRTLLESGARPDHFWMQPEYTVQLPCPPLQTVSPLPLSVLQRRLDITKMLVEHGACLDHQTYSFKAGIEQKEWSGTAIHIPVASGNIEQVKQLVQLGASLTGPHSKGSNGCNLVWQTAYFGHHRLMAYLLEHGVEVKNPATFPDDASLILHPLHVAALKGHEKVIRLLAKHHADLDCSSDGQESDQRQTIRRVSLGFSGQLMTPLEFAIDKNMVDSVRVLVEVGANLFGDQLRGSKARLKQRPVDLLFAMNNSVVISAAAEGLKHATARHKRLQMKLMTHADLIYFLETCGEAANHIVNAIFTRLPRFTYLDFESKQRVQVKSAYLQDYGWGKINAAIGPDIEVLEKHVETRSELTPEQKDFLQEFVPQEEHRGRKELRRVDLWQCLVKDIDSDPIILDAFTRVASLPGNEGWFMFSGVQAIAELHWSQAKFYAGATTAVQIFHVFSLIIITATINTKKERSSRLIILLISPSLLLNVIEEVVELYCLKARKYWNDSGNWLAWLRMSQEVVVVVAMLASTEDEVRDWVRCSVAVCVLLHWMKLLENLKTVAHVGYMVAPITTAIKGIVGICIVTLVYLLAFTHAYWALNRHNFWKSFIRMWSLGLLGDFDFADLENNETGEDTEMGFYVRIGFLVMSFSVSIVITNIFIGVLGNGYNQALENAWGIFLQERAAVTVHIECILQHFKQDRADKEPKYIYYCEEADRTGKDSDDEHDPHHKTRKNGRRLDGEMVRQIMQEEMKDVRAFIEKSVSNDVEASPWSKKKRLTLARDLPSMRMSYAPSMHTSMR